tara:strand:+ start:6196 stop:7122 length:927 start_codon:yes stop_codon:yes gene_type:complete
MKSKLITIFVFFLNFFFSSIAFSVENKILFKINNEIISTIDVYNETKYLKLINPKLQNLDKENIYEIAKNSLIRENIKKIELLKNNIDLNIDDKVKNEIKSNFSKRLKFNSITEMENFLKKNNINQQDIFNKIIVESMWNSLIVKKFIKDVKIDQNKIKKEINKQSKQDEYFLFEIVFDVKTNENLDSKFNIIKNDIEIKGFENTAIIHSLSPSAKTGGELGWIKASSLNDKIEEEIKDLKNGEITNPIVIPGGFLILKLQNKRVTEKNLNIEKELKLVVRNKTNEQLNQFSIIYFNKIKKDIIINEL